MKWFVELPRLVQTARRLTLDAYRPSLCVFATLLASCGQLSLGSYGTAGDGGAAGNDAAGAPVAGGPPSTGGYGKASGGASPSHSTAGSGQAGGLPERGGAGDGAAQAGSAGAGASSGGAGANGGSAGASGGTGGGAGAGAGAGGEAGEVGSAGQAGGGEPPTGRPSCRALSARCGEGHDDDCCRSIEVPAGRFVLGLGSNDSADATVSNFSLDKYEVTVGRFRNFLSHYDAWRAGHNPAPGAGANPRVGGSGWQSAWDGELAQSAKELEARIIACENGPYPALLADDAEKSMLPMNCVNWYEASAFCAWDGARLPTVLEWEYAATGGDRQSPYPWCDLQPTPAYANYGCFFTVTGPDYDPTHGPCAIPVGSKKFGAGRWGHLDLAGSVAEWVYDGALSYPSSCSDCTTRNGGSVRDMRGGGWSDVELYIRTSQRRPTEAEYHFFFGGLRCATSQRATCADSCDPNADCSDAGGEVTCSCREGFIGDGHTCKRPSSCAELHRARPKLASGRYVLAANDAQSPSEFLAFCEMSLYDGGWTFVLNQDDSFDPTTLGSGSCYNDFCTSPAYSRVPLESDLLLDFSSAPIGDADFSARALIRDVQPPAPGKTIRELFTTGRFFIDNEDNSNVSVSVPSQVPCDKSMPRDLASLLCQTCPTGQSCSAPVLVFGDDDSGCTLEPLRFAIGGAHSYSKPWDNCAGWPQEPDFGGGDYYPKNVRIWVR